MGRRPRNHQPSSAASLSIGLTTILVAGLAFVDSFNLLVSNPQHGRRSRASPGGALNPSAPQSQWGLNLATAPATRRGRASSSCSASPRGSAPGGPRSSRRTAATGAEAAQQSTGCVTTRTRTSAEKVAATKLSRAAAAAAAAAPPATARGNGKDAGGDCSRKESRGINVEGSSDAGVRRRQALEKRRLQRSIGGVEERSMSRGQLVGSFAMMGAAATLLGASGSASASAKVRLEEEMMHKHSFTVGLGV